MKGFSVARLVCYPNFDGSVVGRAVARGIRRRKGMTGRWRKNSMAKEKPFCVLEEEARRSSGPFNARYGEGSSLSRRRG